MIPCHRSICGAAFNTDGVSRDASASDPMPRTVFPKKVRLVRQSLVSSLISIGI